MREEMKQESPEERLNRLFRSPPVRENGEMLDQYSSDNLPALHDYVKEEWAKPYMFSIRAWRALWWSNVHSVADMTSLSVVGLLKGRNCGKKTAFEIAQICFLHGHPIFIEDKAKSVNLKGSRIWFTEQEHELLAKWCQKSMEINHGG